MSVLRGEGIYFYVVSCRQLLLPKARREGGREGGREGKGREGRWVGTVTFAQPYAIIVMAIIIGSTSYQKLGDESLGNEGAADCADLANSKLEVLSTWCFF